ncbi:MAG: Pyrimidine/purine nucleotide 5'-monophosphate nucleosidase [Sodalis sp.]|nr:MAG: Pyrimidine/purine nucleotide 5'-monophosphate nucleosidase [Sodalis sp.]
MTVCESGHSINEKSRYARAVSNQLGLRELNICTDYWPGAMEAPCRVPWLAT